MKEAGENVDPAFRKLPFDEKARTFMQRGVRTDRDGELTDHRHP